MSVCAAARAIVQRFEGYARELPDGRAAPYLCPAGVWTIGYGSTRWLDGRAVTQHTLPVTRAQADELLARDLDQAAADVDRLVIVPLTDAQRGALASWVYNLGAGNLRSSTLLRLLNGRDYYGAAAEFPRWVMAGGRVLPGLVSRRAAERALFEGRQTGAGV